MPTVTGHLMHARRPLEAVASRHELQRGPASGMRSPLWPGRQITTDQIAQSPRHQGIPAVTMRFVLQGRGQRVALTLDMSGA